MRGKQKAPRLFSDAASSPEQRWSSLDGHRGKPPQLKIEREEGKRSVIYYRHSKNILQTELELNKRKKKKTTKTIQATQANCLQVEKLYI